MRPVFCGNFEYDTRQSELERLFSKYGRVERIDMKSGTSTKEKCSIEFNYVPREKNHGLADLIFYVDLKQINKKLVKCYSSSHSVSIFLLCDAGFAFVYFEDERDADDAIRGLDNMPFGYDRRRLSVEWAKGERGRHRDGSKSMGNQRPTKTLFVINFDPIHTRVRDIERHFESYGKVLNVRIRRNFAFVQFENQEDATKALECTHMSKILDRIVSVEYALRDDDERGDRYDSPRRHYGRRGDSPCRRSPSPVYRRGRPSPDYGRHRSPVYDKYNGTYERRRSPDYGRNRRSPVRRSRT